MSLSDEIVSSILTWLAGGLIEFARQDFALVTNYINAEAKTLRYAVSWSAEVAQFLGLLAKLQVRSLNCLLFMVTCFTLSADICEHHESACAIHSDNQACDQFPVLDSV